MSPFYLMPVVWWGNYSTVCGRQIPNSQTFPAGSGNQKLCCREGSDFANSCAKTNILTSNIMGKKGKKSSMKKMIGSFVMKNRVMLAAVAGAATGITLASALGTEKAKKMMNGLEDSVKGFINTSRERLEETKYPG